MGADVWLHSSSLCLSVVGAGCRFSHQYVQAQLCLSSVNEDRPGGATPVEVISGFVTNAMLLGISLAVPLELSVGVQVETIVVVAPTV